MARQPTKLKVMSATGELTITVKQHTALGNYIRARLDAGRVERDAQLDRYSAIDRQVAGYLELSTPDKKRAKDNAEGKSVKATDANIPMVFAQIDEGVTAVLTICSDNGQMYPITAPPGKENEGRQVAAALNHAGRRYSHFSVRARAVFDCFKYNFGGMLTTWDQEYGMALTDTASGLLRTQADTLVLQGNKLTPIDVYNFFYDTSVAPSELYKHGEFCAQAELRTSFRLMHARQNKQVSFEERDLSPGELCYWKPAPIVNSASEPRSAKTNWTAVLSGLVSEGTRGSQTQDVNELVRYWGWVPAKQFGLSQDDALELWYFELLNGVRIIRATQMTNVHQHLPAHIATPTDDGIVGGQKSFVEMLADLQTYASGLVNTHIHANRKKLGGLTIYDSTRIPALDAEMMGGGIIPVKPTQFGQQDLRSAMAQFSDAPDTRGTLPDVNAIVDLMQLLLPTNVQKNVVGLERATMYQAAAAVHGTRARTMKIAQRINDSLFAPNKLMQLYNLLQFQTDLSFLDEQTGEPVTLEMAKVRSTQLEFSVTDGLKGLDKMMLIESVKDVIGMLLQSEQGKQYDMGSLIKYWLMLTGERLNFDDFKIEAPGDNLPPDQRAQVQQLGMQALQQQQAAGQQQPQAVGNQMLGTVGG